MPVQNPSEVPDDAGGEIVWCHRDIPGLGHDFVDHARCLCAPVAFTCAEIERADFKARRRAATRRDN